MLLVSLPASTIHSLANTFCSDKELLASDHPQQRQWQASQDLARMSPSPTASATPAHSPTPALTDSLASSVHHMLGYPDAVDPFKTPLCGNAIASSSIGHFSSPTDHTVKQRRKPESASLPLERACSLKSSLRS